MCDKGNNLLRATPGGDVSRVHLGHHRTLTGKLSVAQNIPNGRYCLLHNHKEKLTSSPTHCGRVFKGKGGEVPNLRINGVLL